MGTPRVSSRYTAEKAVLDQALTMGGLAYTLETPGQAISFRQRAYYFRTLLFKELNLHSTLGVVTTPYDALKLTIRPERPCTVLVEIQRPLGVISPLENPSAPSPSDDLLAEALETRKRLIGG